MRYRSAEKEIAKILAKPIHPDALPIVRMMIRMLPPERVKTLLLKYYGFSDSSSSAK